MNICMAWLIQAFSCQSFYRLGKDRREGRVRVDNLAETLLMPQ